MAKDFNDFEGLTRGDVEELAEEAANAVGFDFDGYGAVPTAALPEFSALLSVAVVEETLRLYHKWTHDS